MDIVIDNYQKTFSENKSSFVRLLAPAGSGKTLSLLWRCRWLMEQSHGKTCRILIFTFTRAARDELRMRLNDDKEFIGIRNNVKVETLNQWGYSYLKNTQRNLSIKDSKTDNYFLIRNVLRPVWSENHPIANVLEKMKQNKYHEVMTVFNELKSSGFQHRTHQNMENHFNSQVNWLKANGLENYFRGAVTEKLYDLGLLFSHKTEYGMFEHFLNFWKNGCEFLWKSGIISLDDQKYWSLLTLQEKYGNSYYAEANRFHHIMVDEFQDINPLDLSLINQLVKVNQATLTIVGDDDQAIFEWRGSSPNFILKPDAHFSNKFETHELSINYRSPENIVDYSQNLISNNLNRVAKVKPRCANKNKAEVITRTYDSHSDSLDFVLELAKEAVKKAGPKELAIIGRKKSQIIPIQILLTANEIPYYAKEDLNVLLSAAFDDLKDILYAVADKDSPKNPRDIASAIVNCCNYVGYYPQKKDAKEQITSYIINKRPKTIAGALDQLLGYTGALYGAPIDYYLPISNVFNSSTISQTIEAVGEEFKGMKKHYGKSDEDIFFKDPPFYYLAEFASKFDDYYEFIDHVSKMIEISSNDTAYGNSDVTDEDLKNSIHVMTALRTKGKEFNTVVLLDVNDGIWPNKLSSETQAQLEQERRVFYVAVTRPRQKLVLLSVKSIESSQVSISPYLYEMGLSPNFHIKPG